MDWIGSRQDVITLLACEAKDWHSIHMSRSAFRVPLRALGQGLVYLRDERAEEAVKMRILVDTLCASVFGGAGETIDYIVVSNTVSYDP